MKLIYEDADITSYVNIQKADYIDNAGGKADSLELKFDDPKGIWSKWKPEKNHKIQIKNENINTGNMFIDEIEQNRGTFILRALSIPQEAKTYNTKPWENVRFLEFVNEIASKYGFKLKTYNIDNNLYVRVDQYEQTDFTFLAWRCLIEGYVLKIVDNTVVIYNESYLENVDAVKTVSIDQFDGDYKFKLKSNDVYSSSELNYGNIKSNFKPKNSPYGPVLKNNSIYVGSQGECDRYCKNLLRFNNKYEYTGKFTIKMDTEIAAGCNINIKGVGLADGKYFCEQVKHQMYIGKTQFIVRKVLEGY